ncbi:MAG: ATP-binding cassette domain-containing protein [Enterococcus casseliflavus]
MAKSTLLSLVKGLQRLAIGTITYQGCSPDNIEVVFQELHLFPWQTVYQALEMPLIINQTPSERRKKRVASCLAELGLTQVQDRYPHQLIGGQKQRPAMGRGPNHTARCFIGMSRSVFAGPARNQSKCTSHDRCSTAAQTKQLDRGDPRSRRGSVLRGRRFCC